RVAGRIAQTVEPGNFCQPEEKAAETPFPAVRTFAVPGIDVLAEQRDFPHAGLRQPLRFGYDLRYGAGHLRAACVGNHAEGAELVAPLLNGEKSRDTAAAHRLARGRGQMLELVLDGVVGLDHLVARSGAPQHGGQAMIGLRADDKIDRRRPPQDFPAFSLGDAARNADHRFAALFGALVLDLPDAAELRIYLFRRLFANVAGVEEDEVRLLDRFGGAIAFRRQRVRHALGIVHIHLAAIGLYKDLLFHGPFRLCL